MKKHIKLFVLLFILPLILNHFCSASELQDHAMVYASGDELEYAYNALWQDQQIPVTLEAGRLSVVKESITRVYCIDPLEYARTGEMTVEPLFYDDAKNQPVYMVKMIDENGDFAGNMRFSVKDGTAYYHGHSTVSENALSSASCSYADHAERIRKYLGEDELISPTDVIYVMVDWIGKYFYIKNEKYDLFFSVGSLPTDYAKKYGGGQDTSVDAAKLKELSDRQLQYFEEHIAAYREWKAEHPDEEYISIGGYGGENVSSVCSELNDIKDISNYFNIDFSVNRGMPDYVKLPVKLSAEKTNIRPIIILSASVAAVAAVSVICFIAVRKKKRGKVS